MKSFIIELPSKKVDSIGTYKSKLLNDTVFKKYPWMSSDATHSLFNTGKDISYAGPLDGILFDKDALYDMTYIPKSLLQTDTYKVPKFNLFTDYNKVMKLLQDYAELKQLKNPYSYTINGTPVDICGTYIRIGNTIIPYYTKHSLFNFNDLPCESKKEINIVINIVINTLGNDYIL